MILKGFTLIESFYTVTIFCIKSSTLYLWHRLFPSRVVTTALYVLGGVILSYSIVQLVCVVLQCIPLSMLWKLKVNLKRKLQLIVLFSLGGFVLGISIIRLPQLTEISHEDESCERSSILLQPRRMG